MEMDYFLSQLLLASLAAAEFPVNLLNSHSDFENLKK